MSVEAAVFVRDRTTRLSYGGLAIYAYVLYALGPLLPLLRSDLDLSYALMSAHSAVFAGGAIVANGFVERLTGAYGYRGVLWASLCALAGGSVLLAVGQNVTLTLTAAAVMGVSGALVQTTVLTVLARHHGVERKRAIVEANAAASAAALAAPLLIGAFQTAGAGWRPSMLLPLAATAGLYAVMRRESLRPLTAVPDETVATGRLSRSYWLRAALCGTVVGAEFCLVFYASPQLTDAVGLSTGQATTAMSLFFAGTLLGRLAGSRLSASEAPTERLALAALAVTAVGFTALWAGGSVPVALAALLVAGLGIANLFPLALSLAVEAAGDRTDQATTRVQLLVSVAIMLAPLMLGALSDRFGVSRSFAVEGVLLAAATVLLLLGRAGPPQTPYTS